MTVCMVGINRLHKNKMILYNIEMYWTVLLLTETSYINKVR